MAKEKDTGAVSIISSLQKAKGKAGLWFSRPFSGEEYRRGVWLTMGVFAVLWFLQIWISQDILLTFRQVINFTEGLGMVSNVEERVQVFTHPSWFVVLSIAHVLSGGLWEPSMLKYSSTFLMFCFFCGALWLFLRGVKGLSKGIVAVLLLALLSSQAFTDYGSSGLENPLSYFLVALVVTRFFSNRFDSFFFLLCALLFLNRMDYALLLLPMCLYAWHFCRYRISVVFPAVMLCLLWLLFSTWYFGYPLTNTFLAKMNADISRWDYIYQSFFYYKKTLTEDPVTLFVIFLIIFISFYHTFRQQRLTAVSCLGFGSFLYCLYIVRIGGDYMQGRFFSVLFFFSVCGLSFWLRERDFAIKASHRLWTSVSGFCFAIVVFTSAFSIVQKIDIAFFTSDVERKKTFDHISNRRYADGKTPIAASYTSFTSRFSDEVLMLCCPPYIAIDQQGKKYMVDYYALTSPYLSRLPAVWWQVGHAARSIPTDFEAWIINESDSIYENPQLNTLFSDIREVVRGDLFSWKRMKNIVKINFHDYGVDYSVARYKNQPRFSQIYPSMQQKMSLDDLLFVDEETWNSGVVEYWRPYNVTQSVSISLEEKEISKISFLVRDITEYYWVLYNGQKKIYEDSYKTDRLYSFHTFTLPHTMKGDNIKFFVKRGGSLRRLARPILE